ncbi:MAG: class F sortase [Minisyncoccia bacterium]
MIKRKLFLIATVAGLSALVCFVFYFVFLQSGINSGLDQITAKAFAFYDQSQVNLASAPLRLKIPEINLDAAVEYAGITSGGVVGVPKGPINVAWFDLSAIPGTPGVAVIDGHAGWHGGIHAVFDDLPKLKVGDKMYVTDKKGTVTAFVVRAMKNYPENGDASDLFTSTDGGAHLNLVTCAGVWNPQLKTHSERLVVFADKVAS